MSNEIKVRWGWLKLMYIYTIVGAGGFGLGIIFAPNAIRSLFGIPSGDPITFGITGSVYLSSGILAIFGLRAPLKFAPLLLLQLIYKVIWFIGVVIPLLAAGSFPTYAIPFTAIFASYIIGDLVAIPFSSVLARQSRG